MNTVNKLSHSRKLTVVWLVLSQIVGALLAIGPIIAITGVVLLGGGGMLFELACVSFLLPLGCAVAAWMAFARGKDRPAAILSGLCLLIGAVEIGVILFYTNSFN